MASKVLTPRSWSIRGKMLAYAKENILPVSDLADAYDQLKKAFPNVGVANVYALKICLEEANKEARKGVAAANGEAPTYDGLYSGKWKHRTLDHE